MQAVKSYVATAVYHLIWQHTLFLQEGVWRCWSTWLSCGQPEGSVAFLTSSLGSPCWPPFFLSGDPPFDPLGQPLPFFIALSWFPFLRIPDTWSPSLKSEHTASRNTPSIRSLKLLYAELTSKLFKHENACQTDHWKEEFFSCLITVFDEIS